MYSSHHVPSVSKESIHPSPAREQPQLIYVDGADRALDLSLGSPTGGGTRGEGSIRITVNYKRMKAGSLVAN